MIDDDSVVDVAFFFDVVLLVFTDFLTDFFITVVSELSKLSTADYISDLGKKRKEGKKEK